jgi:hypothetical protein
VRHAQPTGQPLVDGDERVVVEAEPRAERFGARPGNVLHARGLAKVERGVTSGAGREDPQVKVRDRSGEHTYVE